VKIHSHLEAAVTNIGLDFSKTKTRLQFGPRVFSNTKRWSENLKERDNLDNVGADGRVVSRSESC
jgi:hypothetical protein